MNNEKEEYIKRFFFENNKLDYEQNYKYDYYEKCYNNHFNKKTQSNNIIINIFNYFYNLIN